MSISRAPRLDFERHIKRLAWAALLASLALLVPTLNTSVAPGLELAGSLAAAVLVVAVWAVIKDVGRYVREEQARRREAAEGWRRAGACLAADTIQDRVANLLSVTVGYAEFLSEDDALPPDSRDQARRVLEGALAAARVVSTFRQTLGCEPQAELGAIAAVATARRTASGAHWPSGPWVFNPEQRTITSSDGALIATLAPTLDRSAARSAGRLLAAAPETWEAMADAQQLGVALLSGRPPTPTLEAEIQQALERLNEITSRLAP